MTIQNGQKSNAKKKQKKLNTCGNHENKWVGGLTVSAFGNHAMLYN